MRVAPETMRKAVAGPRGLRFLSIGAPPRERWDGREKLSHADARAK